MSRIVHISQASRSIEVPAGRTILEAALDERIPYPHGCRSGRCGACKSRLVSGEVDLLPHTLFALSPEERQDGPVLACRAIPLTDATMAWLSNDEETDNRPVRSIRAHVVAVEEATHDIKRITLFGPEQEPFIFRAGQYAELTFPGAPTRAYSMANVPGERELEFHVRRVPGGAVSERVATHLRAGAPVLLRGPFGSSFLRERHSGPILAIAGGSGLAPIKSIVETALAEGLRQPIHVCFGVRRERDLYLVEHFERLASQNKNLSFVPVLSEQTLDGTYRAGNVSEAVAADFSEFDGWKAYVAGPPAMVEAAGTLLKERGLRDEDLHADAFFTPEEETQRPTA